MLSPIELSSSQEPNAAAAVAGAPPFVTASVARELGILLALSVMFPFLIHVLPVPEDARLGPRLLPMYYAPLLAALLGRPSSALSVAVAAPWLNWALTGHPDLAGGLMVMLQLVTFVVALRVLLGKAGARWYLAAPAYLCGLVPAALLAADNAAS